MVVNASGPWITKVLHTVPRPSKLSLNWVKGINLIFSKPLFLGDLWGGSAKEKKGGTSGKGDRVFSLLSLARADDDRNGL